MKIAHSFYPRRQPRGMITVVLIVLLSIMMLLVLAESRSLIHLRRENKFLEQQQIKRLNRAPAVTNAAPVSPSK